MEDKFRVGISADFKTTAKGLLEPHLKRYFGPLSNVYYEIIEEFRTEFTSDQLAPYDGVITLHPRVTAASLEVAERLAVIARWGVGYNMIDVPACTARGVLLAINRDAVRRPVAEGVMTLLLGLTHHLLVKDRLVRGGRWQEKTAFPGVGLEGRVLGLVGLGNIGSDLVRLARPFDLGRIVAFDPYAAPARAADLGVELVGLPELLDAADFVCVTCPLTDETYHLIGAAELERMRPTSFLINTSRGPIVDQAALTRALKEHRIAGAGLDVFETEPLGAGDPLLELDNVILSPHAIGWTDALVRGNSVGVCENVLTVLKGEVPAYTVNGEVAEHPGFRAKLAALSARWGARDGA